MLKKYQFTKYGAILALLSLIPLVPVFGIIPSVVVSAGIEKLGATCEVSYQITLLISTTLATLIIFIYTKYLDIVLEKTSKSIGLYFGMASTLLYIMVSTIAFIMSVGVHHCCHGDGQTGLAVFFTAPFATAALLVFGIIVDVKKKTTTLNT